ncbi:gem-associated protein 5 isoform X2 [Vespa crabro]|uniref:gem-associated protein 5 isoform X2 n=1 Tax=Vespa crabro TaxID=7445 RepID=UPI001F020DA2|nr:gem-associated protein 5 isoform X2 [Vespa crabro]
MNEVTLPPSPNWYLNSIFTCSKDGTIAWGARNAIIIAKRQKENKILNYSIIKDAHIDRVTSLAFSPEYGQEDKNLLVSSGDEFTVRIWNLDNLSAIMGYSYQDTKQNVIGVDWCLKDPNIIYCISTDGLLISWNVSFNTCYPILLGKLTATCLSVCPHDCNLVAIGSKTGLVYIVDTHGTGSIRYKLRGHDTEISSLSWCPVEHNILTNENNRDLLLASGAKDKSIFLWRAGGDGRYQLEFTLPNVPFDSRLYRNKSNVSTGNWISVCWAKPKLLLTSSYWGELLAWDLKTLNKNKPLCKMIHAYHNRILFSIVIVPHVYETINDSWRIENGITVWTLAQDRQIICCNIKNDNHEIEYNIPTQGGFIYCIAACPVDNTRIAFGVGDTMLRIWNLSEPHETSFDITMLWQKIKSNIRSIAWHPVKENLIAYGTAEGRIGMFDINVYTLQWGPYPGMKDYALYSCGEGDLVCYDADKPNKDPTLIIAKKCTEVSWKPDFSCLAIGLQNGTILFYNRDLKEFGHTTSVMNVGVHCLIWHPDSTATDLTFSPLRNYIAVAYNATIITILDLSDLLKKITEVNVLTGSNDKVNDTEEISSRTVNKIVATLNGHSNKIVGLSWSPHLSGYLVSSSYDCTAQVWNVERQELIATFAHHCGPIYCCMWSPLDPDLIITGSSDFTLRLWRISTQPVLHPEKKSNSKKSKSKKNKQKINEDNNKITNDVNVEDNNTSEIVIETINKTSESATIKAEISMAIAKEIQKKIPEKSPYFPTYSKIMNNKLAILKSIKYLIKDEEKFLNSEHQLKEHAEVPSLFTEDTKLSEIINNEKSILTAQGNHIAVTEIDMWHDNLKENLEIAVKEKRLNDTLISLSPSLSMKTWREMCEAYANQLILESNPTKAVSYLLCIHKIYEAIDVFQNAQMFKEAYCLANSKLDSNDTMIKTILENWANYEFEKGHFEAAAHCHVKLGAYSEAASLLARRKDVECLTIAAKLALLSNESVLSKSLVEQAIMEALKNSDISLAENIILKFPQIKYLEIHVKVFKELKKILEIKIEESTIHTWLKGEFKDGILQIFKDHCEEYKVYYDELCQYSFSNHIDNQAILWINVSGQLAMAIICDSVTKQLTHLINALSIISQFEILHRKYIVNHGSSFIKVLINLDSNSPIEEMSIYARKCSLSKSLRAYLCIGLLNWIVDDTNLSINDEKIQIIQLIEELLEDILEKETVRYWSLTNEITKLETEIVSNLGKTQKVDENSEDDKILLKKLDDIKNEKKRFVNERICAPSPILVYSKANELIDKFSNENVIIKFSDKLNEIWIEAIK